MRAPKRQAPNGSSVAPTSLTKPRNEPIITCVLRRHLEAQLTEDHPMTLHAQPRQKMKVLELNNMKRRHLPRKARLTAGLPGSG